MMRGVRTAVLMGLVCVGCGPQSDESTQERESKAEAVGVMAPSQEEIQGQSVRDDDGMESASDPVQAANVRYKLPFSESSIGYRWHNPGSHTGVDFMQPNGTKVPAVADGEVVRRGSQSCFGNYIVVKHADGKYSAYAHLLNQSVSVGNKVKLGNKVGEVGRTGTCATGPHLHLAMSDHIDGFLSNDTFDPLPYIKARD